MLKDRIVVDENGFQVNRESADPERKAYYATFTLADEEIDKSQGKQIKYWDAMNPYSRREYSQIPMCIYGKRRMKSWWMSAGFILEMEELSREFHGVLKRNRHMVIMRI